MDRSLSTAEVAALAGVHRDTLLRWLRQGSVAEPRRDSRGWRVFSAREAAAITVFAGAGEIDAKPRDEEAAISRLKAIKWDFTAAKTEYLTHNLHPYPAKFIPQIPNALIQELSSVGDTVGDIFCGSGTTLLEALMLKRHALGIDANPLAVSISKAKTTPLAESDFEAAADLRRACLRIVETIDPGTGDLFHEGWPFKSAAWRPAGGLCEFWFEPHVVEELAELRHLIGEIPSEAARNLCAVAFAAIVVTVSKQDSDTRYVRRVKVIEPGDTVRRYIRQLDGATAAVRKLDDVVEERFACKVLNANTLEAPDIPPLDLVVTSPPYPNAYSYHLYHRSRLIWLGHDAEQFKKVEVGSHRKYSAKGPNKATPETFRREFGQIFDWLRHRLRDSGHACFVIGDSTLDGTLVDNSSIISNAGVAAGFREVARINRKIATTRKSFNPKIGKIRTENVLILRKA